MSVRMESFSNPEWLAANQFVALSEIARLLEQDEQAGRGALIRTLENRHLLKKYEPIITALIQRAGLYPYLLDDAILSTGDLINLEYHSPAGLKGIVLHAAQAKVYRAIMDGINVILSAPTSFGKSLLIDATIASGRFSNVVIIVPTIALIDETRRRLSKRFHDQFKIITHPSQSLTGKNIFVLTQERFVEFNNAIKPEFFVLDEFYKLSPNRGDERTFVLNQAFYQLFKSGAQFFLIGPNVQDITIDETDLNFRFFRFDFTTVATEIRYGGPASEKENALSICKELKEPTLIFCKSSASAYELASFLISHKVSAPTPKAKEMAAWIRQNYHPDWILPLLLENGFAVHHGSLPRSIAYHLLRKFNDGSIRFLLCTSTIIEGVNTSAKSIVIYDNKIATKKFDQFTFNNIKGRAGRMLKHFVGHVYVLHSEPDPELPIVDFPSLTQPDNLPESLLIHLENRDLSEKSKEQLKYLYAQDHLPIDVLKNNSGMDPRKQIDLAAEIAGDLKKYHPLLSWTGFPNNQQLFESCRLIFDYLMEGHGRDGIFTTKQLHFQISRFARIKSIPQLVAAEIANSESKDATEGVENVLRFLRQWCEFHFPRCLTSLDRIQRSVFDRAGLKPGNYEPYCAAIKHLFMPPSATILEEFGLPYNITGQILSLYDLGREVDSIIDNFKKVDPKKLKLTPLEYEMFKDTMDGV